MTPLVARARHLPALDGLRAVAVFIVIAYHAELIQGIPGDLGVTLFFVLSGFLITWLLLREFASTGSISIRAFYTRRALRIFPAYYMFILFSLALDTARGHRWSLGLISVAFTYLVNYYNAFLGHPTTSIAHAWSLAVEEQFYLLWPLACLALLHRSRAVARRTVGIVIVAVVLWRSALYLFLHAPASYVYNAFDTRCDALAIGCFIALSSEESWFASLERRIRSSSLLPLVPIALILLFRHYSSLAYHYSVGMTVDAVLIALFMIQMLGLSTTRLWSWLDHPITRTLGLISYPCYLYHAWGLSVGEKLLPHGPKVLTFAVGYAATLCMAWGSFKIIERPFLTIKDRISASPPSAQNVSVGIGL
ncbi:MAG: acyltransferase [Gemmatimonadaceae bacterium]